MRYTFSTLKENGIKLIDPTATEFCCSWPWGMPSGFLRYNNNPPQTGREPPANIFLEVPLCTTLKQGSQSNFGKHSPHSAPGTRGCNRFPSSPIDPWLSLSNRTT